MSYGKWCAVIGRMYAVVFLVECFAALIFRAWGPLEGAAALPLSAAIIYGVGTPSLARACGKPPRAGEGSGAGRRSVSV